MSSLSFCFFSCNRTYRPPVKTGFEGKSLPSFELLLSDSTTSLNTSDIPNGKPVVLLFFSPRCPFCRAEIGDILKNISELRSIRFYLLTNWPFRQFKGFYTYYQLSKYSNIVAGQDYKDFFLGHFKPIGVPFTMIYGKDMKLNKAFVGPVTAEQIKEVSGKG